MIDNCDKCINKKDSKMVNYIDWEYSLKIPDCFLEYYNEDLDDVGCVNFEILK